MSRTFAYARISTVGQETENQIMEIEAAGFKVEQHRIITETISGSVAIAQRKGFSRLLEKKVNRRCSGRYQTRPIGPRRCGCQHDGCQTGEAGIRVHCLALGGVDLTSFAGKLTMGVINAVAQFERDLLIERTQAGLARAKAEDKSLGCPTVLSSDQHILVRSKIGNGKSISAIAREFRTSRQTIMRVRDQA